MGDPANLQLVAIERRLSSFLRKGPDANHNLRSQEINDTAQVGVWSGA